MARRRSKTTKIFAKFFEEAGADSIQLRTDGFGEFNGSLHLDRFFYPELPEHLKVKELDWTRRGRRRSAAGH